MSRCPLVSFIVVAYKQERFVREAVRSALAQTYEPLEILLSDDCSPDRTFEIMKEEAGSYSGPHRLVLNQNQSNLGLAGHLNLAFGMAKGDVFVMQGGDDRSLPERTSELLRARSDQPAPPDLICSHVRELREDGSPSGVIWKDVTRNTSLKEAISGGSCVALGATAAYSRTLFDKYGPIDGHVLMEDWVLSFRALLEGGVLLVEQPLVDYRIHNDSISSKLQFRSCARHGDPRRRRRAEGELAAARQWLHDWDISKRCDAGMREAIVRNVAWKELEVEACGTSRFRLPIVAVKALFRGHSLRRAVGLVQRHAV